jgi:hypothetical protein
MAFVEVSFAGDGEARHWARGLPVEDFPALLARARSGPGDPG